jgi:hypothetical protein
MRADRRKTGVTYVNDHPLYNMWCMMKQRCNNPRHTYFALYGGKGVKVCDRWNNSFWDFVQDVGERPSPQHTIDRFPDKNGNYGPDNFRWAIWAEQNSNRNTYAIITVRYKKNMAYAAYLRKKKINEKFDKDDLLRDLKEDYPSCEIVFKK